MRASHQNIWWRFSVKDGAGAWRELTNESGFDWVDELQWGDDIDAPTMTGSVIVRREIVSAGGVLSLAPLVATSPLNLIGGSYAPLLNVGREMLIETANTAPSIAPTSGQWKSAFEGFITDIAAGSDPMTLTITDKGSVLVDMQIEQERDYGDAAGTPLEAVLQQMLDDNAGAGTYTLYVPVASGAFVKPYRQLKGGLLDAMRTLALRIGWNVRYQYDASDVYRLTFYSIDRAKTTPDATIDNNEWLELTRLDISNKDVRNVVRVNWQDKTTLAVSSAEASDAGSIAEFRRRFMEIGYGSTDSIDSQPEGQAMADIAVSDLSTPLADQAGEQFYFWPVQNGDLLTYVADGEHYTDDQTFGVVAFQHSLTREQQRTNIAVRGKIAGAYKRWLNTRNGEFPGGISEGPAPLIFPPQGEFQAFEDPRRDGRCWQQVQFEKNCKAIEIYAMESATSPTPIPVLANNQASFSHLQRSDGDQWSGDDTSVIVGIPTRANFFRKTICIGIGENGERGPAVVQEVQAIDVGAGPSAPPTSYSATPYGNGKLIQWLNGDASAYTLLFRNGIGKVLQPGVSKFLDSNIQVDIAHTYYLAHWKNGQTSAILDGSTVPATGGGVTDPQWVTGYPFGGLAGAFFQWTSDPATTEIAIEFSRFSIIGLWEQLVVFGAADTSHVPDGSYIDVLTIPIGVRVQARIRALVNGDYHYSTPKPLIRGAAAVGDLVAPVFVNGTPERVTTAPFTYHTHVEWTLDDPAATSIDILGSLLNFPGVALTVQHTVTTGLAAGSYDVPLGLVLAQLRANYPTGSKSGPIVSVGLT
jgi:hypothetical protein